MSDLCIHMSAHRFILGMLGLNIHIHMLHTKRLSHSWIRKQLTRQKTKELKCLEMR